MLGVGGTERNGGPHSPNNSKGTVVVGADVLMESTTNPPTPASIMQVYHIHL